MDEDDIVKFCEETNLPVALDETVNNTRANPLEVINNYTHSGIVAVVSIHASLILTFSGFSYVIKNFTSWILVPNKNGIL